MDIKQTSEELDAGKGLVRLFNQVEGAFIHEVVTKDDVKRKFTLTGKTFTKVPAQLAEYWLKQYPHAIISDTDAHAKVDAKQAELDTANKEIVSLKAQLAKAKKPLTVAEAKAAAAEEKKAADAAAKEEKKAADAAAAEAAEKTAGETSAKDSV